MAPRNIRVGAVIVTYYPDTEFFARVQSVLNLVDEVVIVDNGSPEEYLSVLYDIANDVKVTLLSNQCNEGVAAAINKGLIFLMERGYQWVVTFDQDSSPEPQMLSEQLCTLKSQSSADDIAIISPKVIDDCVENAFGKWLVKESNFPPRYQWITCEDKIDIEVDVVITSGSLMNMIAFRELGPLREDFFIDYVDTEYCIRARLAGYKIVVSCAARLRHRLGNAQVISIFDHRMVATNHSAIRHYYMSRNRIAMYRLYAMRVPYWVYYDIRAFIYTWITVIFSEKHRASKILMTILGTWHGIINRMGKYKR